jgi:hypothetical protein
MSRLNGVRIPLSWTVTAAAALLLSATPLTGQESTTRGLNLAFHFQGASLKLEDSDAAGGGGGGIRVGYGINRIVTLYAEADGVTVEAGNPSIFAGDWTLGHAELGARFHFANSLRSWVPFLEVAAGARAASVKDVEAFNQTWGDAEISGGVLTLGGGIYAYFSETLALEVDLKFSTGEFTQIDLGPLSVENLDVKAQSTRFKVGVIWWP